MHLKHCNCVIRLSSSFLCYDQFTLIPSMFGWKSIDGIMIPEKGRITMPDCYTVTCGCRSGVCRGRCKCQTASEQKCNV